MNWKITYYNQILEEEVLNLPDTLLARFIRYTEIMREHGPHIGPPHTEAIGEGLYELRLKGKEGIARVFFCMIIKDEILMLHCIRKKQQKTPLKELRLAKKRLTEVKRYAKTNT